jgi:hypothetical protein
MTACIEKRSTYYFSRALREQRGLHKIGAACGFIAVWNSDSINPASSSLCPDEPVASLK